MRKLVNGIGWTIIWVGVLVLVGWQYDLSVLKSVLPGLIAMNPLSALCFIGIATTILIWPKSSQRVYFRLGVGLAVLVTLIAFLRLLGYLGVENKIDVILFKSKLLENRMAPNTAWCFFLLGCVQVLAYFGRVNRRYFADLLLLFVFSTSLLTIIGYAYKSTTFYGLGDYTPMALNTGICFCLSAFGIFLNNPTGNITYLFVRQDMGGRLLRRMAPFLIVVPIFLGWLRIQGREVGLYDVEVGTSLLVIQLIILLSVIAWNAAKSLSRTDRNLTQQNQILKSVLDSIGDGVVVTDAKGNFVSFNPAADHLTGVGLSNKSPGEWAETYGVFKPDMATPFPVEEFPLVKALQGIETNNCEQYLKNKQVEQGRFISVTGRPLRDIDGEIQGGVVVFRDVTAQKMHQIRLQEDNFLLEEKVAERMEQLKKTQDQIQHLQKMNAIGRLAGGVAHDFNNILGAIYMYCDLMSKNKDNVLVIADCVKEVRRAADRGADLVSQLLLFSRKQELTVGSIDLNRLILELLSMLRRLTDEHITLDTSLTTRLPEIQANAGQVEQIIINLIINGRDAMPNGGKILIETHLTHVDMIYSSSHLSIVPGNYVVLTVSDEGTGIEPEVLEHLFEPFFTTKPFGKGTGLGLSTVYGIVKAYSGTIEVESVVGQGSKFKIYFPVQKNQLIVDSEPVEVANRASGERMIVLVEDEKPLLKMYKEALEEHGYEVLSTGDSVEALDFLTTKKQKVDLLLSDLALPMLSGLELSKRAREVNPDVKVILMSGYFNDGVRKLCAQVHNLELLEKPFDQDTLISRVRQILSYDEASKVL